VVRTREADRLDSSSVEELVARIRRTLAKRGNPEQSMGEMVEEIRRTIDEAEDGESQLRESYAMGRTVEIFSKLPAETRHKVADLWQRILEEELEVH